MSEETKTINIALQNVDTYGAANADTVDTHVDEKSDEKTGKAGKHVALSRFRNIAKKSVEKKKIMELVHNDIKQANDHLIKKVNDAHYVFSKGETQIHVQTFDASELCKFQDDINPMWYSTVKFTSWVIFILFFGITAVIKLSIVLVPTIDPAIGSEYKMFLYTTCFVWATFYLFHGTANSRNQMKSNESSNKYLKGVVGFFGMAILVDDGLQILQNFSIGTKECFEARIDVALYFMHMFFVITQVAYIYRYSKVFIRSKLTHTAGPKIGLMFLIATNISCWFISVVDEAVHALHEESGDEHGESDTSHSDDSGHEEGSADHDSGSSCTCDTSFCNTANIAQEFLFPFVIEFSLVSSFLLYIVWKNVGKTTPPYENIIRPSYKIYNSYIGIGVGFLFVFSTIIIMIVLGNTSSDGFNQQSYALDAAFTTIAESLMIIGCSIGFYLFIRIPRPNEPPLMLDVVLLVICVLGPIIQDLFTLLAVIDGTENKIEGWGITVVAPLWDIIQCVLQLAFIICGLQREPQRSEDCEKTVEDLRKRVEHELHKRSVDQMTSDNRSDTQHVEEEYPLYITMNSDSINNMVSKLADETPYSYIEAEDGTRTRKVQFDDNEQLHPSGHEDISEEEEKRRRKQLFRLSNIAIMASNVRKQSLYPSESMDNSSIVRIVSETNLESPDKERLLLRNMVLCLLIANACLWLYMSLSGTAYNIDYYQSIYFGSTIWTTILQICRPLSIFYRMHSAGCLFEIWSYA